MAKVTDPENKGGVEQYDANIEAALNGKSPFRNLPLADFSQEGPRKAMKEALAEVGESLGKEYPLVINGKRIHSDQKSVSINPSHTHQIIGHLSKASTVDVDDAVAAAKLAFETWRHTPARERAKVLLNASEIMRRRKYELAAWQVYEEGKNWVEADADLAESIDYLEFYAREALRLDVPRRLDIPGETNEYFYEPRGVCVVIAPWNFPLAISAGMTTAALVAGNTVVYKPSGDSPVVGAIMVDILNEAGLPQGVLDFVPGPGGEIGDPLVSHPDVGLIAFTGSREIGLRINRLAADTREGQRFIKRVIAEMGGKNALIVAEDADLDAAAQATAISAYGYQGQKCSACSRAIVLEGVYNQFLESLVDKTSRITIGPPEDPDAFFGPLINEESRKKVLRYIDTGKSEGRLILQRDVSALENEGYFVGPTIFADVPPNATIAQDEIFGPVLSVIRAKDIDDAIRIANDTDYALTGGGFSQSQETIQRIKREFKVGNLYINRKVTGSVVNRQPFGGFKMSGIGSKAGGPDYLLQFMIPRTVTEKIS
jgi:RHH-type transcriptional regulator, proline utilization regulon repressor / proline dehydrogenase / delta 1-pyrroline-5-carboxylate dehydrogenase